MTTIVAQSDCNHEWIGQDYHCLEQHISLIEIKALDYVSIEIPSGNLSLVSYECISCNKKKIQIKLRNTISLNQSELACSENYEEQLSA